MYRWLFVLVLGCYDVVPAPDSAPPLITKDFGSACNEDTDCNSGLCAPLADGLCTETCVFNVPCEEGYCVFSYDGSWCYPPCPCLPGWLCFDIVGVRLCAPDMS